MFTCCLIYPPSNRGPEDLGRRCSFCGTEPEGLAKGEEPFLQLSATDRQVSITDPISQSFEPQQRPFARPERMAGGHDENESSSLHLPVTPGRVRGGARAFSRVGDYMLTGHKG
ncbi:hypothetical protein DPX16_4934 [Anabarilius grahami]|uniref:Uncharacterized protein n=1 Tax=Anabarilius grahami TaxID=495550 RepID=A0A3N0XTU8_ANAGA|nr:hypothetical protein DPX16_4934 [Anabarilius grahami]